MKLKVFFVVLMLLVSVAAAAAIDVSSQVAVQSASFVNQDPDPAEPGGYVDVRFKLDNVGSDTAKNAIFELQPVYPFSLDPGVSAQRALGSVDAGQVGDKAYVVRYKLRIDRNAVQGNNELRVRLSLDNGNTWRVFGPFEVNIRSINPVLSVDDVTSKPDMVAPGETFQVDIKLTNSADTSFKNIKANLQLIKILQSATAVTVAELPFSPTGSTNEKNLVRIDPGQSVDMTFNLVSDPGTKAGVYKVPLSLSYVDDLGKNYSTNNVFSIKVGEQPDVAVLIDSSTAYEGGTGKVTVKFINKGSNDLKFVYLQLKKSADYDITSSESVYLGNINSDDYASADFALTIKATTKDKVNFPILAEYRDTNNQKYTETYNLDLRTINEQRAEQLGLKSGEVTVGIIIVVLIIVAGLVTYWFIRRKRKK